jgi:hypothetical protein
MTPREKANELVVKYQIDMPIAYNQAKQCTLIAVDEILNLDDFSIEGREYWQEVKQEIHYL